MAVEKRRGMEDQEADPLVVSPQVAARLLGGTSVKHIFDLVRSKQLGCIRDPRVRIPVSELNAYIHARLEPGRPRPAPARRPAPAEPAASAPGPTRPGRAPGPNRTRESFAERCSRCRRCPGPGHG